MKEAILEEGGVAAGGGRLAPKVLSHFCPFVVQCVRVHVQAQSLFVLGYFWDRVSLCNPWLASK